MMSPEDSWVAKWQRISQYTYLYCVVFVHSESLAFFNWVLSALWLAY